MQAVRFAFRHHKCSLRSFAAQAGASSPSSRCDTVPTANALPFAFRNGKHLDLLRRLFIPAQPQFLQWAFSLFSATGCRSWSRGCVVHWQTRCSEPMSKKRGFPPRKLTWSSRSTYSRVPLPLTVASMSTSAKIFSTACYAKSASPNSISTWRHIRPCGTMPTCIRFKLHLLVLFHCIANISAPSLQLLLLKLQL